MYMTRKKLRGRTFYLFAIPSFFEGMARVLDLGNTLEIYNEHESEEAADRQAILNDWLAVGDDIQHSIDVYERSRTTVSSSV